MKTSYFTTDRGGRLHYHYAALMNGQSVARVKGNCGLFCTIFEPKNNTLQWYWVDEDNNIRWLREHRNYNDIDWLGTINDHKKRGKENKKSEHWLARKYCWTQPVELETDIVWNPQNFYKVFNKFFECDHILHPEVLLGYHGYTKADREGLNMSDALLHDNRYMNVDLDYSIDQMKKRKNVIVYKEDIRRMARSWFLGGGQNNLNDEEYYSAISCRINEARKIPACMQVALDRYNIPYEMWSLDKGDYNIFGFNNELERYVTEGTLTILKERYHSKVDQWIDRYMSEFHEV